MPIRVFVVEDEADLLGYYVDALTVAGYQVVGTAANGAEALERLAADLHPPDVIIMDHRMPVMNGLDATRVILGQDPTAKIIFASADEKVEQEARQLGVLAFQKKPFSLEWLIRSIREVVEARGGTAAADG
jgi:CheY-like chemotaxis protein